jgi:hypothetical protein
MADRFPVKDVGGDDTIGDLSSNVRFTGYIDEAGEVYGAQKTAEGLPKINVSADVQSPLASDGDSVYVKDIWVDESIVTGWTDLDSAGGDIISIPFNELHTAIENASATNPKVLRIHFNRTVSLNQVGLGCADHSGKNFSNVLIKMLGSGEVEREVYDASSDATKRTSYNYQFSPELANAIQIEFHTADAITITNITIHKVVQVAARLKGIRPDGVVADVNITMGENLKVSMEEIETGVVIPTTYADDFSIDAFGRRRVSGTGQRADVEFIFDAQPLLFEKVEETGATVTHQSATRDLLIENNNTTVNTRGGVIQRYANPYTPGNSQLFDITGTLNAAGISGGTAAIFLRNNSVDTVIEQANWDSPQLDVDFSKSLIFMVDFQSLKVGRLRYGLVRNGLPVKIHEITNDNVRLNGYWQYPSLPLAWRIYNDGSGNTVMEMGYFDLWNGTGIRYTVPVDATAQLIAICATCKSEGGPDLLDIEGFPFASPPMTADKTISSTTVLAPIASIRVKALLNSLRNTANYIPTSFSLHTDEPIAIQILRDATLTGASWNDVHAHSGIEHDVAATVISGGVPLLTEYASTAFRSSSAIKSLLGKEILSLATNATLGDTLTIAAIKTTTADAAVRAALGWKEIR